MSHKGEVKPLVEDYGQVIVDECHHIGARSFEATLKPVKAKYVLSLTATPIRRDEQDAIIFMQCGPLRPTATKPADASHDLAVLPCELTVPIDLPEDAAIRHGFRYVANDQDRTESIAAAVREAAEQGRKILVLTESTDHSNAISSALTGIVPTPFMLDGRRSKKKRADSIGALDALDKDALR